MLHEMQMFKIAESLLKQGWKESTYQHSFFIALQWKELEFKKMKTRISENLKSI